MEVSTMIGTEIFSPVGEKLGYVKTVYLSKDRKKITCLLCVDEADSNEEADDEFVMPFRAVLSVKDVVIAKKARIAKPIGNPAPVGVNAYSDSGEALGTLCEILVGDGGPVYIVTKNGVRTSYPEGAVTIGEALMISLEGDRKEKAREGKADKPGAAEGAIKSSNPTMSESNPSENNSEAPMPGGDSPQNDSAAPMPEDNASESGAEPTMSEADASQDGAQPAMPEGGASGLDRLNLLGRHVKIAVRDKNGELIADSGEKITPEIISNARRNNLLLRLTVNTLTNLV